MGYIRISGKSHAKQLRKRQHKMAPENFFRGQLHVVQLITDKLQYFKSNEYIRMRAKTSCGKCRQSPQPFGATWVRLNAYIIFFSFLSTYACFIRKQSLPLSRKSYIDL